MITVRVQELIPSLMDPILAEILRNTVATRQPHEVAFMHICAPNIMPHLVHASPPFEGGGTFSLGLAQLMVIQAADPSSSVLDTYATGPYFSVVLSSSAYENRPVDAVVAAYVPDKAAATAGNPVFHFFEERDADRFVESFVL